MDWSNEPYVRIYTRKTVAYLLYPWQSRAIRDLIFKDLDRAGVLECGDADPVDAVAATIMVPREIVEVGLPPLLKDETFILNGSQLVNPNYIDAQEAKKSDKARQKESRERRRDRARLSVTGCDASVTKRDSIVTDCDDTVTAGHAASHGVTLNTAELSIAEQSLTYARARENTKPEPRHSAALDEHPLDIPPDDHLGFDASRLAEIIDVIRRAHQMTAYRAKLSDYDKRQDAVNEIIAIAEDEGANPEAIAGISYRNYVETKEKWLHNAGYPLGAWVQKVGHFYRPPAPFKDPEEQSESSRKAVYDRDTAEFERKAEETMKRYRNQNPEETNQAMTSAKELVEGLKTKIR